MSFLRAKSTSWMSLLAVFTLCLIVSLAACSKKDVVQDEPAFGATGDEGATAGSEGAVGTEGAGDAGMPSSDLRVAYFAYDSYSLGGDAREALKYNANWLKENASATIQIEGHCDERGTTEYNIALGEKRANAAKDYLVRLGVDASRVSVISYGEERPSDPGHDESAWGKNRRAAFVILSN